MPRLTSAEKREHQDWLSNWRKPAEMASYVDAVNDTMGATNFFGQGGIQFLRDAWTAAEFGRHHKSEFVRLVPEQQQWPDFEAQKGRQIERIECGEADVPGRRRGAEYQNGRHLIGGDTPNIRHFPVKEWATAEQALGGLCMVIAKKVAKQYAEPVSLLLYLNVVEFGAWRKEIEAGMEQAVMPALPHFRHVWVLWKSHLYGPWQA